MLNRNQTASEINTRADKLKDESVDKLQKATIAALKNKL
jgi:hypothetical protein